MNLGTNAARAMGEESGIMEVSARVAAVGSNPSMRNAKLKEGEYVRLTVSDSGCGMDQATLERIFDPFFTTRPPGQGTGLGLSVVHGIIKDHDGSISVYSEVGKGTVFDLYFPAIRDAERKPGNRRAPARGRGQRLMYVDDEEGLVMLCTRSLERMGYQVIGECDPVRAAQRFLEAPGKFDAVVTDLSMPVMSGAELVQQIKAIRADIPVVMMSGYLRPQDEEEARRLGVRALILKPDTIEELARILDEVFSAGPNQPVVAGPTVD
jgi:CheY-like chemotaxis protein